MTGPMTVRSAKALVSSAPKAPRLSQQVRSQFTCPSVSSSSSAWDICTPPPSPASPLSPALGQSYHQGRKQSAGRWTSNLNQSRGLSTSVPPSPTPERQKQAKHRRALTGTTGTAPSNAPGQKPTVLHHFPRERALSPGTAIQDGPSLHAAPKPHNEAARTHGSAGRRGRMCSAGAQRKIRRHEKSCKRWGSPLLGFIYGCIYFIS
uniref:Uncharacterized protein n=1 Tax=Knipowitschia caucasica TaxID=637954 RepID=A0AAV2J769_KNICA